MDFGVKGLVNGTSYAFLLSTVGRGGLESPPVSVTAVPEEDTAPPLPPPPVPNAARPGYALPVSYVGTVKAAAGKARQAIFKDESTGEYVRLRTGDAYRDVKVIEIRVNSVILENEKGTKFTLPQGGL